MDKQKTSETNEVATMAIKAGKGTILALVVATVVVVVSTVVFLFGQNGSQEAENFVPCPAPRIEEPEEGNQPKESEEIFCTMDAKQCPDGSFVGRDSKNNCEFNRCPGEDDSEKEIDTGDWQTYRNEEYGFEMKYPKEWKIDTGRSNSNKTVFELGFEGTASIEMIEFEKNLEKKTLEDMQEEYRMGFGDVIIEEDEFVLGDVEAWRIDTGEMAISRVFLVYGNNILSITSMGYLLDDQILATFKFTK